MAERKHHYNWDGFRTFCGRSIREPLVNGNPALKITSYSDLVTCGSCLKAANLAPTPVIIDDDYCVCGRSQLATGKDGYYCLECGESLDPNNYQD